MTRWWKCVVVAVAWLGLGVRAQAQQEIPSPVGAARMMEPLGYKPEPQPDLVPGPLTPQVAPPGPPPGLDLPASHSSAFQTENYTTESAFFGSIGMFALQRNHPGNLAVAFDQLGNDDLTLRELHGSMNAGVRATVGYLLGSSAVEVTGSNQFANTNYRVVTGLDNLPDAGSKRVGFTNNELAQGVQGKFSVPFSANGGVLPGFGGIDGTGIWNGADLVRISYQSQVGSGELNYRSWDSAVNGCELILGVRWLNVRERFNVYTDQGAFTDARDPLNTANYAVTTLNNIVGFQVGTEYSAPCEIPCLGWIWFTGMAKAAVGPNFVDRDFNLVRGDGFLGFNVHRSNVEVAQVYEMSAFIDFHLAERIRLRAGYTALWAVGISNPDYQFSFNLSSQGTRRLEYGSAFYSGPVAELEFLW